MQRCRPVTGPLLLIALGVLFLANTLRPGLPLADLFLNNWPYLLIIWGALQLIEVLIRFQGSRTVPINGISAGSWIFIVLIALAGSLGFHARHVYTWARGPFFLRGVRALGHEHEFSLALQQRNIAAGSRIIIENFRGDAKIVTSPGNSFSLTGRKLIAAFNDEEAEKANGTSPVELIPRGDTVIVRCHQNDANSDVRITTNLELTVPREANIEATGIYGDFDITGLRGNVDLSSENAGVRLQDIDGAVKLDTRASDNIRCTAVRGSVDVRGRGSEVELTRIQGPVTINGGFTGAVTLRDLAHGVSIENFHTRLSLKQIRGEVRMERGELNMADVAGPVDLTTRATDVKVERFTDGLNLKVDKGDIELRPMLLPLASMAVYTRSGNIEMDLPQAAGCNLRASTRRGEIQNEFGGPVRLKDNGKGAESDGTVGTQTGADVRLQTDRGRINIRKSSDSLAKADRSNEPPDDQ